MFQVLVHEKKLEDGTEICTFSREIISANILEVEAGSNGYYGGDSGHGSRTYFRIEDLASTDMEVNIIDAGNGHVKGFEVTLGGDTELETMIKALKFITQCLEDAANEVVD